MHTDEAIAENIAKARDDGPRIRGDYNTSILARGEGAVLIGGLGGFGVGRMWAADAPRFAAYPGYSTAPFDPSMRDDFTQTAIERLAFLREASSRRP